MNWSDVGHAVASFAPVLGSLLPIPGASVAGALIAREFGVANTPDAIHKAVTSDPDAAVKLAKIEADNKAVLENQMLVAGTERIAAVNKTMQEESKSEHWAQWGWRPFWGFASGIAFVFVAALICFLAYKAILGGKPEAMAMIPQLIGAFAGLFAIPGAILGVSAYHRGKTKLAQAQATHA